MVDYVLPSNHPYQDLPSTATPLRAADYNAAIEAVADLGAATGRVANLEGGGIFGPLTGWSAQSRPGAATYTAWIAAIDIALAALVTAGTVVKQTIGTASDATSPILAYTCGAERAPHVLLAGGLHGHETIAQTCAREWFLRFATSTEPVMRAARAQVRVTWIPVLNAGRWNVSRETATGVDLNRNWPFNWDYLVDATKGSAALSEPESIAAKGLLDTYRIGAVIDCHDAGSTDPDISFAPAWQGIHSGRAVAFAAADRWRRLYDPAGTYTSGYWGANEDPTLRNYAAKYLRWDKFRVNAATVLLEGRSTLAGSTSSTVTAEAIRLYAGMIHTYVMEWARNGQADAPVVPYSFMGRLVGETLQDVSIETGGSLVSSFNPFPVQFDSYPGVVSSTRRPYIDVPIVAPGYYILEWDVFAETNTGVTTTCRARAGFAPTPVAGGNVAVQSGGQGYAPTTDRGAVVSGRLWERIATIGPANLYRAQLFASSRTNGEQVKIRGASLSVRYSPDFEEVAHPTVSRSV